METNSIADDPEKRFQGIMNKLFHSPNSESNAASPSNTLGAQNTRGQKRPFARLESKSQEAKGEGTLHVAGQAPPCRPWNRDDLLRRLATFKSMTWFARPKVINAVNCARRGWVNVDADTIACETCGARLLFSTPSSWSKDQVEKAALVFSLKLDNGHKLLCPWTNNACDEKLALFPSSPAPVLVDQYRERSTALLRLLALPVIPASAVKDMKSPAIEHFLRQSIGAECGNALNGSSWTEYLGDSSEAVYGDLYYQAHRLLSLCGWEPRLLPYIVDYGDQQTHSTGDVSTTGRNTSLTVYHSGSSNTVETDEDSIPARVHYDPNSTVLECKLCGASVGLWAFRTVPRPLELVRVVGYTENGGKNLGSGNSETGNHACNGRNVSKESMVSNAMPSLSLTIAGGPPPTKQNFRAKISLPVIGRNLRDRFTLEASEGNAGERKLACDSTTEALTGSTQNTEKGSGDKDGSNSAAEDCGQCSQAAGDIDAQVGSAACPEPDHNAENRTDRLLDDCNLKQRPRNTSVSTENTMDVSIDLQTSSNKTAVTSGADKDLTEPFLGRTMEFHPVKLHRHFCPWIASTETVSPGWQQTLLALEKEKVFCASDTNNSPLPSSLIEVDDPLMSIRQLFKSPSPKRKKLLHGSG